MRIDFEKLDGLVPVIAQDYKTGKVLQLAFMNQEAWEKTLAEKKACYFSRSRNKLWTKGESSGHFQIVKEILVDCDNDSILLKVKQIGKAACHDGYASCFYKKIEKGKETIVEEKVFDPNKVYGEKK
ncbi:MAG: phosphoribosyl-AMP cyclohydrolase [Candidatus Diapherotrites archaeon]|uniref:Phosphoribosyl-AMP cyclohydrolase n=1 Tax=Candidatus Iainarchaeum sp. TaxID=3101447 RepID=A0A8T4L3E8_9ARCH|nr:phosphoribosyl-AMP cyclohydrolase [Candidatus Diapherotrites archaeon]